MTSNEYLTNMLSVLPTDSPFTETLLTVSTPSHTRKIFSSLRREARIGSEKEIFLKRELYITIKTYPKTAMMSSQIIGVLEYYRRLYDFHVTCVFMIFMQELGHYLHARLVANNPIKRKYFWLKAKI